MPDTQGIVYLASYFIEGAFVMKFELQSMVLGMVGTNCYVLINNESKEVVLFDPADHADKIISYLEREELKPVAILLTHGHFDHIMAAPELAKHFEIPVYAHELEQEVLKNSHYNACAMIGKQFSMEADQLVKDGDVLNLAGMEIKVIHTPGHTQGGVSYYMDEVKVLICGDTLFESSIGRTDLPTSNQHQMLKSIDKLLNLPPDTKVYPGHGKETTIEKFSQIMN